MKQTGVDSASACSQESHQFEYIFSDKQDYLQVQSFENTDTHTPPNIYEIYYSREALTGYNSSAMTQYVYSTVLKSLFHCKALLQLYMEKYFKVFLKSGKL